MTFAENSEKLKAAPTEQLVTECIERLMPILTHKQDVSTMRVPVDFEHDDDVYVIERLREIKQRTLTPHRGKHHG